MRHLARLAPRIRELRDEPGAFLWDDLSVLFFTPEMRARTVFVFHHYEPLQFDSWPLEPLLWRRLFAVLPQCRAVVCVTPSWATFLRERGVDNVQVIYNAFDLAEIDRVRGMDPAECKARLGLPTNEITVYAGKAVHWKGIETVATAIEGEPGLRLVTTGSNTIGSPGLHFDLPRPRYLELLRACRRRGLHSPYAGQGGAAAPRSSAPGTPCLIQPIAGLGDLARLAEQPHPDPRRLAQQIRERADAAPGESKAVYETLARFDTAYFGDAWSRLLAQVTGT